VFTGIAEANATVTLLDGANVVGTGVASALGAWSVTTSALAAGAHALTATATDRAGNVSVASVALPITIDTAAPLVPSIPDLSAASDSGVSNTDNITNVTRPVFTGTAEANATVTLLDGVTVVGSGAADALGAWSVTASALAAGAHAITAKATDLAGNTSVASAALPVTIDTKAPLAPSITQVTTGVLSGIAGTAEAASTVALFDGATKIGTSLANAAGVWSIPFALTAGTHALTANATDLAGNGSVASAATTAIIGTVGNDVLSDTPGTAATMVGGAGNDTYVVHNAADIVTEQANDGTDTINTTLNSYTLGTNVENLTFIGVGSFTGTGNALDNIITGGAGIDTLIGGGGNDTMTGGAGNDFFKYLAGNFGADTITDFDSNPVGGQDLIDLTGRGITAATFAASVKISASGVAGVNTLITIGASSITLDHVALATVNATDFRLAL
jgi:Ca2+-binding RTX toxin-like protein